MKRRKLNSLYFLTLFSTFGLLTACASTPDSKDENSQIQASDQANDDDSSTETITETTQKTVQGTVVNTGKSVPGAAQAPLRDLNVVRIKIPEILTQIEYVYLINEPVSCDELIKEIESLNEVLGPSEDIKEPEASKSEKATKTASGATESALEGAATGWIPFRSVLRYVTGATAHERALRQAYETGLVRRSFLKGIGGANQCPFPARALSLIEPQSLPEGEEEKQEKEESSDQAN